MFGYLFASLLLPMFARLIKLREPVAPLVSMSFKLIWAGSVTLTMAIFFAREDLLRWMMPLRASDYRFDVLGVLIWAFIPVSVTYIFSTLLTARQLMMKMNRFFLMGIAIDVALNLLLIPHWQAFGSAVAAVVTQVFISGAMVWLSIRAFGFRPRLGALIQIVGFAIFIGVSDFFIFEKTSMGWGLQFVVALSLGLVGLVLFQLVDLKKARKVISP